MTIITSNSYSHNERTSLQEIALKLGAKYTGGGKCVARCPAHADKTPSLSITEVNGKLLWCCHAGCTQEAVMQALDLRQNALVPRASALAPFAAKALQNRVARSEQQKAERIECTWSSSVPIAEDDPVHRYLKQRNVLPEPIPSSLRYHPSLAYWDGGTEASYPAMVAQVESVDGRLVTLHRTYLTKDGQKAPVGKGQERRLMPPAVAGTTSGASIHLGPLNSILGIAEGIETALACHRLTELSVWAAVSAGGLEKCDIPDSVDELIIFADNDESGRGEQAARTLAKRMIAAGKRVKIITPSTPGTDWADESAEIMQVER